MIIQQNHIYLYTHTDTVSEQVRMFEEEQRTASAVTQAKQCPWTNWNDIKPIKLLWKSLIVMEPLAISFLLRSIYDLLPNATKLKLRGYTDSDLCLSCKSDRVTLHYVLSACPQLLQMYTWWHHKVLEVVIELFRAQCDSKPATCYSQGTHNSVSQGRWMSCEETKKSQYDATEWS